jgi:hypothetical protein
MDEERVFPSGPGGYPPCCPPADAVDANIVVYRTVTNNPPQAMDFLSWVEEGKVKPNKSPKCDEFSVSVMLTKDDALHHRNLFGWAAQHIAMGKLTPENGKTKPTPTNKFPSHVEWWSYVGVMREALFNVEKE